MYDVYADSFLVLSAKEEEIPNWWLVLPVVSLVVIPTVTGAAWHLPNAMNYYPNKLPQREENNYLRLDSRVETLLIYD